MIEWVFKFPEGYDADDHPDVREAVDILIQETRDILKRFEGRVPVGCQIELCDTSKWVRGEVVDE